MVRRSSHLTDEPAGRLQGAKRDVFGLRVTGRNALSYVVFASAGRLWAAGDRQECLSYVVFASAGTSLCCG